MICKLSKKLKKFEEIEDVDIILQEQRIAKDSSIAHFSIDQKAFEIDYKEIKILDKIGDGGGSGVVYSAIWNNHKVAFKCYIVQDFATDKFGEFEKEVSILASLSFPYILKFYGVSLLTSRGICRKWRFGTILKKV